MSKFSNSISNQGEYDKEVQEAIKGFTKLSVDPKLEENIYKKISLNQKNNPKLDLENCHTDFIEYKVSIPPNNEFIENQNLVTSYLPGTNCILKINYSNKKVAISFSSTNKDANLYAYIIFRVHKYGLEFIHLKEKDYSLIDINKFLYLCDEDNKIKFKFYLTKNIYK